MEWNRVGKRRKAMRKKNFLRFYYKSYRRHLCEVIPHGMHIIIVLQTILVMAIRNAHQLWHGYVDIVDLTAPHLPHVRIKSVTWHSSVVYSLQKLYWHGWLYYSHFFHWTSHQKICKLKLTQMFYGHERTIALLYC